jgi:ABC-2 type transport system permease protein
MLTATIAIFTPRFGQLALATGGVSQNSTRQRRRSCRFRRTSPIRALRRKEWILLRRDPWLVSQTLMQLLYLLPPAFLLRFLAQNQTQRPPTFHFSASCR